VKHYIIRGGVEGKKRLELLGRAMWPTTARALERAEDRTLISAPRVFQVLGRRP
jgi:hypothetical protein